jgi:hypothetical protein
MNAAFLDGSTIPPYNPLNNSPLSTLRPQRKTKIISASFAVSAVKIM